MVAESTQSPVDATKIHAEIERLESELESQNAALMAAVDERDFQAVQLISGEIATLKGNLATQEKRYAAATGQAVASVKTKLAEELQELFRNLIDTEEVRGLVRQIWGTQADRKLTEVIIGYRNSEDMPILDAPTVSLKGGFRVVTEAKPGASKAGRKGASYSGGNLGTEVLTSKELISRFGAKYNIAKDIEELTPADIQALRQVIVLGEGLTKVKVSDS